MLHSLLRTPRTGIALSLCLLVAACGGGGGKGSSQSYDLTATVSGLSGSGLVLEDGAGGRAQVSGNGSVTFGARKPGSSYTVSVTAQPTSPSQTCVVSNASGTIGTQSVDVSVQCSTKAFGVGGTVSGLKGGGLRLQINQSETVGVTADGKFQFPTAVASGTAYSIIVAAGPSVPAQVCAVSNAKGQVGASDVTNVAVACDVVITQSTAQSVAFTTNRINGLLLQLTEFVGTRLTYLKSHLAAFVSQPCTSSPLGTWTAAFSDRDNNGALSEGDGVTLTLQNCYANSLGSSPVNGEIVLTIGPPPQPASYRDGFSADITLASFSLNNAEITGTFHSVYTDVDELRLLQASVSNSALAVDKITVVNATISRKADYTTARYELRSTGQFDSDVLQGRFSFDTPTPVSGWFNIFPDSGLERFTAGPSVFDLPANDAPQNSSLEGALNIDGSGRTIAIPNVTWGTVSAASLWLQPDRAGSFSGFSYPNDLFQWGFYFTDARPFADPANRRAGDNLSVNTAFKLFFSGPLDGTRTKFVFVPSNFVAGAATIPAEMQINGAIVVVKPQQQLEHGLEYELKGDPDGAVYTPLKVPAGSFGSLRFSTSNNLLADGYASPAVAAPGQTVVLQSTRSFSTNSSIVGVSWRQVGGTPVQISNATTTTPSFVVPSGIADGEALKFELTVQDANGETDTIGATAFVLNDMTQPFFYRRLAQGPVTGRAPESAKLSWSGLGTVTTFFSFLNEFRFILNSTITGASDDLDLFTYPELQLGTYPLSSVNRVSAYQSYSSCSNPTGQYVVRDIVRGPSNEVVRFAADYEVDCPNSLPQLGSVRVNSTVPLP